MPYSDVLETIIESIELLNDMLPKSKFDEIKEQIKEELDNYE
ncbi:MAG: hypothetical protein ACRCWQ_01580 [Bacilli bacterium]